jgi:looped-hinge helix DNA binding domain, AbrB family
MEVLGVTKVSGNRVWIPKTVRERLRIKDSDLVYFYENDDGEIVIKKVKRNLLSSNLLKLKSLWPCNFCFSSTYHIQL